MKTIIRNIMILLTVLLSACTVGGTLEKPSKPAVMQLPDGSIFAGGTISNSIEGEITGAAQYAPDPTAATGWRQVTIFQASVDDTVGGDVVRSAVPSFGTALINRSTTLDGIRAKRGHDGNTTTWHIGGGVAQANAHGEGTAAVNSEGSAGTSCTVTSPCAGN